VWLHYLAALKGRQVIAHGVSRGYAGEVSHIRFLFEAPAGAKEGGRQNALSPLAGLKGMAFGAPVTHGSRRGLLPIVPSALKSRRFRQLHLPRKTATPTDIRLATGQVRLAELHWYEAHGKGRKEIKRKRYLD